MYLLIVSRMSKGDHRCLKETVVVLYFISVLSNETSFMVLVLVNSDNLDLAH